MTSIHHNTENRYSLYGINHFIQKYGIPIKVNGSEESKINIVYSAIASENKEDFVIQVRENEFPDEIKEWIKTEKNNKVSLFKTPFNLNSSGQAIVTYRNDNKIMIGFDIFKEFGYILLGQLDKMWSKMDNEVKKEKARIPIVDFYEEALFNSILYTARKLDMPVVQKAFWSEGKKFAVCLTHDVDELRKTYQYFTRSFRCLKKGDLNGLKNQFLSVMHKIRGEEPYWTFDEIMDLERRLSVKSTFYFLRETGKVKLFDRSTWRHYGRRYDITAKKVAELIRTLHSKGWEVGLHGSFYSYNDLDKLKKEKEILEEVLGSKVHGIRQHNLNLDIPNTWMHQEKIGLEYDTTLGFNDCIGFKGGTCFPFHPVDKKTGKKLKLLEIPLVIEDIALFSYDDPWKVCKEIISTVEKYNGVLTLLWHHSVFNKIEYPGWAEMYEKIIKLCKEKNAWIASAEEIARWWRMREESRLECEYDDNTLKIVPYPEKHKHFINVYLPQDKKVRILSANAEIINEDKKSVTIRTKNLNKNEEIILEMR